MNRGAISKEAGELLAELSKLEKAALWGQELKKANRDYLEC